MYNNTFLYNITVTKVETQLKNSHKGPTTTIIENVFGQ